VTPLTTAFTDKSAEGEGMQWVEAFYPAAAGTVLFVKEVMLHFTSLNLYPDL
jgi:hypothetical protein